MGRSMVDCAAFCLLEFGALKSCSFRACLVKLRIGSSCKDIDLALPGLVECDRETSTDGLQLTAHTPDCPFHDVPPFKGVPVFIGLVAGTWSIANEKIKACR